MVEFQLVSILFTYTRPHVDEAPSEGLSCRVLERCACLASMAYSTRTPGAVHNRGWGRGGMLHATSPPQLWGNDVAEHETMVDTAGETDRQSPETPPPASLPAYFGLPLPQQQPASRSHWAAVDAGGFQILLSGCVQITSHHAVLRAHLHESIIFINFYSRTAYSERLIKHPATRWLFY